MRGTTITFDDAKIPAWTYESKEPSIYTFAEAIWLSGLEGKTLRLTADLQRRLLGFAVFGKQAFEILEDGNFRTWVKVCFGQDWETAYGPLSYVGVAAKRKQRINPICSGARYFSSYHYERELAG